jgi:hypothetical protein
MKEAMDRDREALASLILDSSRRERVDTREVVSQAQTTTIAAITQVLEDFGHGQLLSALATAREELIDVPHLLAGVLEVVEAVQEAIQGRLGSLGELSYSFRLTRYLRSYTSCRIQQTVSISTRMR